MKWLFSPILWLLAALVAVAVLYRLWRGKPILLRGRLAPRVIRMVAIMLVVLGLGADRTESAPAPINDTKTKPEEELPPHITSDVLHKWASLNLYSGPWMAFKQTMTRLQATGAKPHPQELEALNTQTARLPDRLRALLSADVEALAAGKPAPTADVRTLLAIADEMEQTGYIDAWLTAHLWRKTAGAVDGTDRKALADLLARLHRQARLNNALVAARAHVRPINDAPIAWRGKAGGPRPLTPEMKQALELRNAMMLMTNVKATFKSADAGTWDGEGFVGLTVAEGSASVTQIRHGQGMVPLSKGNLAFGRFDLLETAPGHKPAILLHQELGRIEIPAGKLVSVWEMPHYLSAKSKETLKQIVADALAGKEPAAQKLERMLPLAQPLIRDGLREAPGAAGAPRLRLILTQFDDAPMKVVERGPAIESPLPPVFGGGGFERGR